MKKKWNLLPALALTLALVSCAAAPKEEAAYTVGICQLAQHEALDLATQGFMDALNEALPGQVAFDSQNASNELAACSGIVNQFVAAEVDLILANATPALQVASAATVEIPILSTSVTEYGVAMGITDFFFVTIKFFHIHKPLFILKFLFKSLLIAASIKLKLLHKLYIFPLKNLL